MFDQLRRDGPMSAASLSAALDEPEGSLNTALEFAECGLASLRVAIGVRPAADSFSRSPRIPKAKWPAGAWRTQRCSTTWTGHVTG
jgi:hypothetical protein